MPIDGRLPNLGFLERYHLCPCHALSAFLPVASGGNYTASVNPVASGVFQMHVLVDGLGLRSAEQVGSIGGEALVWLSFHELTPEGWEKTCQLMRIDGRDLHFIWYLWLSVRGK